MAFTTQPVGTSNAALGVARSSGSNLHVNSMDLLISPPVEHYSNGLSSSAEPGPPWSGSLGSPTKMHPQFDVSLGLNDFEETAFLPTTLLENKMSEFIAEFRTFMQTQSQIYELKKEDIVLDQNGDHSDQRQLAESIQKKITAKKLELCRKWDEYVQDRQEIAVLRRQISMKHLSQFKEMVHFESKQEYIELMQSNALSSGDKIAVESKLRRYRGDMISRYNHFRKNHFRVYQDKLTDLDLSMEQKSTDSL